MRILGIDQSFTNCACVLLDTDTDSVEAFVVFTSDKTQNHFQRARKIAVDILDLVDQIKPDLVAIEGISFGSMIGNVGKSLAGLQFTIVNELYYAGYEPVIIPPKVVKIVATGSGKASKMEIFNRLPGNFVAAITHTSFNSIARGRHDLADAYFIAKAAAQDSIENKDHRNSQ